MLINHVATVITFLKTTKRDFLLSVLVKKALQCNCMRQTIYRTVIASSLGIIITYHYVEFGSQNLFVS